MNKTIFETTDVWNNKVVLYEDVYKNHILVHHPEMQDIEEIKKTVESPNVIYKSKNFKNRRIFLKLGANNKYKNVYTKAVVEYNSNDVAEVTTTFLSSDIQGVEEGGLIYAKYNC